MAPRDSGSAGISGAMALRLVRFFEAHAEDTAPLFAALGAERRDARGAGLAVATRPPPPPPARQPRFRPRGSPRRIG
ncbi:uncharacterized protein SOCE26_106340 [Sorangium cellulosum]|uniref:Uncharacterized protein n=1 Tax=Sorangium cellulosum TaxID=56 RepID=A0A2L0FCC7_SORCE|nr:uncharacterized protein SOCE26_106340 [Sorangium cellulosum]